MQVITLLQIVAILYSILRICRMQITIRHLIECIIVRNLSRDIEGKVTFATDQGVSVRGNAKKEMQLQTRGKNKCWLWRPHERTNSGCGDHRKEQTLAAATREKNKLWLWRPEERTNTGCGDQRKEQNLAAVTTGKNKYWLRRPQERTLAVATRGKKKHWLR